MESLKELVEALVNAGGSDLHLSCSRRPMGRVDGNMLPLRAAPMMEEELSAIVEQITPPENMAEFKERNDTDFAYEIPNYLRLRASLFQDRHGVGCVFRVVPDKIIPASALGLPRGITELCNLTKGLVIVTGPTGSGKSTTLAGMVDLINETRSQHIITIEDPIEFVHEDKKCMINQRELRTHTESFSSALRAALRQDPDIVLIGEMRDLETIRIAIETAETGHLVFATLHTTTAASAVNRIIDAFPAGEQNQIRTMLATSLKGVVAQTLCRKIGGGMKAAIELLIVDRGISALIRDGKSHQIESSMQIGRAIGMQLLNDELAELVRRGEIDSTEAYTKAADKEGLLARYEKFGIPAPLLEAA